MSMGADAAAAAGFRTAPSSGLLVPEDVSRAREVWTNDEWRAVKRALAILGSHHVAVFFRCPLPTCREQSLETINVNGEMVLRCNHKDRVIRRELPGRR